MRSVEIVDRCFFKGEPKEKGDVVQGLSNQDADLLILSGRAKNVNPPIKVAKKATKKVSKKASKVTNEK